MVGLEVALELGDGVEVHLAAGPPARAPAVQGVLRRRSLFRGGRRRGSALFPRLLMLLLRRMRMMRIGGRRPMEVAEVLLIEAVAASMTSAALGKTVTVVALQRRGARPPVAVAVDVVHWEVVVISLKSEECTNCEFHTLV